MSSGAEMHGLDLHGLGKDAAIRSTIGLLNCPLEKNGSVAASPRNWSSALWR